MNRCSTLFFQPNDNYSGSVRVLANVIERDYADQKVFVITSSGRKGFLSELSNVTIIYYWNPRISSKYFVWLNSLIWRFSAYVITFVVGIWFDTFYINTIVPCYAAKVACILHKKVIYHVHEKFVVYSRGLKMAEDIFEKTPSHRIFVSNYLKKQYEERPYVTSEVKYNKLAHSFLYAVNSRPIELRQRKNVIMISSLLVEKGANSIVELAKLMPQLNFVYVINATKNQIDAFYKGTSIPNNLKLVERQSNIHPFLSVADINVNLSDPKRWVETFGMTILEAMAYGIPSIAPNVGGPLEIIDNGINGYCIDVTDLVKVREKIIYILDEANYKKFVEGSFDKFRILNA